MLSSSLPPLPVGALFADRYRVDELIGQGGMGAVYLVHDTLLSEKIALKLAAQVGQPVPQPEMVEPRREVLLARRVTHPNVARVFDLGVADGLLFITMEHVPGQSLRRCRGLIQHVRDAVIVMQQVASAIAAAHDAGVLHLDLKPDNILVALGSEPRAVVIDFGVAQALGAHARGIGTVKYMAPEQLDDVALDGAADVYAFGLVLYELLHDEKPFPELQGQQLLLARRHTSPRPLPDSIPPSVAALVLSCLARERRDRPAMRSVEKALAAWLSRTSSPLRAPESSSLFSTKRIDIGTMPASIGSRIVAARRQLSTPMLVRPALDEIESILAVAPHLDVALAVRALAAVRLWNLASDDVQIGDRAVAAVADAVARAPHLADSHVADAMIADATGDCAWAVRALARAIDREPLHAWAHSVLARIEIEAGQGGDRRALFAADLDPSQTSPLEVLARERLLAGRVEDADALVARLETLPSRGIAGDLLRTRAAVWTRSRARAHAVRGGMTLDGPPLLSLFHDVLSMLIGELSAEDVAAHGERVLASAVSPRRRSFLHQLIAEFVAPDLPDVALEHVARAASLPLSDLRWLDACPTLVGLRETASFRSARARVVARLAAAWDNAVAVPPSNSPHAPPALTTSVDGAATTVLATERLRSTDR